MLHDIYFFSNIITCDTRERKFGEAIAEDQGMLQVASHPHNCPTEAQKGKKEKRHSSVLICFMARPSFVQPLKINNWPNFDDLSLSR